jgi:hypothetical protein
MNNLSAAERELLVRAARAGGFNPHSEDASVVDSLWDKGLINEAGALDDYTLTQAGRQAISAGYSLTSADKIKEGDTITLRTVAYVVETIVKTRRSEHLAFVLRSADDVLTLHRFAPATAVRRAL